MTAITREHLELAALAAGRRIAIAPTGRDTFDAIDAEAMMVWRPHTDPGDAARLAVRRRFVVRVDHAAAEVVDVDGDIIALVPHNDTDADADRAYCEAVTIGAAHEGRWIRDNGLRMREGGR